MYVQPNTPTLPFEANTPHPTGAELDSVIDWFRVFASGAAAVDDPRFASVAAQAAASLVLLRFFAWPRASRAQRTFRRMHRDQVRLARRYGIARRYLTLLCALCFVGCASERGASELEPVRDSGETLPDGAELDATPATGPGVDAEDLPATDAATSPQVHEASVDYLQLAGVACTGHWVESDDVGTRLQAHPDTGRCTLPCQIVGPQRHTCTPEHRAHLEALCAELGGACTLASDGLSYCVAR